MQYLEAPVRRECIVEQIESVAGHIHLVHLHRGVATSELWFIQPAVQSRANAGICRTGSFDLTVQFPQSISLHLGVPGHAESLEPLVEDRSVGPGHIQGLVLEDVLVHPETDRDCILSDCAGLSLRISELCHEI